MEKEKTQAAGKPVGSTKAKSLPITGSVTLRDNDGKPFLNIVMDNPFPDVSMDELRLMFVNEGKTDNWGNVDDRAGEKRKGLFEHFAKEYLKTTDVLTFSGFVTYQYFITKKGERLEWVNIAIANPWPDVSFPGVKPGGVIRVFIRKLEVSAVFDYYVKQRLDVIPAPKGDSVSLAPVSPSSVPFF